MQASRSVTSFFVVASAALTMGGCEAPPGNTPAVNPDPAHFARNSLDWAGAYRGLLPCADCEGIETVVILTDDSSYRVQSRYRGESDEVFDESGAFAWNEAGNTVTLAGNEPVQYFVAENRLIRLTRDGARVTGDLADSYVLEKLTASLTDRQWELVELSGQPVPVLEREPYFILGSADGSVSGFGGCNSFTGTYELDEAAARIRFGEIVSTMMACASGMDVETALHEVLRTADNYSLNGSRLALNRARMAPLARFEAVYLQ